MSIQATLPPFVTILTFCACCHGQQPAASPAPAQSPAQAEPARPSPYGDYQPKLSPDTMVDFRGSLGQTVAALPAATLEQLPALLQALETQRTRAATEPGRWVDGNMILGGDRREYVPTDDELLESEIGDRIAAVVATAQPAQLTAVAARTLSYRQIRIRHVDVMGSGRFFYASAPQETTLAPPLPPTGR